MIQKIITKWEQKHSKLLEEYSSYTKLSENEALFLRSEMKQIVEIIEDLKKLNSVFGQL